VSLCFLFPHTSPQESEFQETGSDRSGHRETEDEGLSGMENNTSFFLLTFRSLLHLLIFHTGVAGHRFWNGKKS